MNVTAARARAPSARPLVLIVDDEPDLLELVSLTLSRMNLETRTAPDVGALKPAISRNAVDFPQPEGPSSDTNSLLRTSRSIGPSAATPLS